MFKDARNAREMSREEAAFRLHIGSRTLLNYEHHHSIVPPDLALRMQDVYDDPTFTAKYCSVYCPIGQTFAHSMPMQLDPLQTAFSVLKEHSDVARMREDLISIMADGVIDPEEKATLDKFMNELLDLERSIEEFKLSMAKARMTSLPELMQKRKIAATAAR